MQIPQTKRPVVLNLDKYFTDLSENESYYILNHTSLLNTGGNRGNLGTGKPLPANYAACDIDQPAGEVYTVGGYRSPLTREIYTWHINQHNVHYILRTSEKGCTIVYYDKCLDLSAEPKHSIENWRAFLTIEKICANRDGRYLKWTNGKGNIHMLDVEASIATDSFSTPFFDRCRDDCAYIDMCVPDPCDCLHGEWLPFNPADVGINNFMLDQSFQFIYQHVYYDGRKSEWSDPSTTFYQSTKGFNLSGNLPRGIKLRIPFGNPMVEKIKIGFTTGQDIWVLTETVEKYQKYNTSQEKWYNRLLSGEIRGYSDIDCSFDYYFYNDRQKIQIDPKEVSRVFNPIPRNAQGFIQIKDSDGFYNYEQGVCPVDKIEIDKIDIDINCNPSNVCAPEYATITVRAIIVAPITARGGVVFREGIYGEPDDPLVTAYFGSKSHADSLSYGQQFIDKTRNFIVTIEGTDLWAEMKQGIADSGFTNRDEDFGVLSTPTGQLNSFVESLITAGKYMYQEAKIRVPKGMSGYLQLVSHKETKGSGASQNTSTYVMGTLDIGSYVNSQPIGPIADSNTQIFFDTCTGDKELSTAFIIRDCSELNNGSAYTGYVKDSDGNPVEGIEVDAAGNIESVTDHNGFYFFAITPGTPVSIALYGEQDCDEFKPVKTANITGAPGVTTNQDLTITQGNYVDDMYVDVVVPVKDCNGNPVPGIRVVMSGTKYKTTDNNGNATFKIRNYSSRNRHVVAMVVNNSGSYLKDCNNICNPCMPTVSQTLPPCFVKTGTDVIKITLPPLSVNTDFLVSDLNGLKSGGRYEFAAMLKGKCGRISAAYPLEFINIPKTQEKGEFGFCSFSYDATGFNAPDWADCLHILRSSNLNNYELQWKIDKIDRVDGNIKLTIQSLNDYNLRYGMKTNTNYQWLKGDRVEFIYNGDGSIFTTALNNGLLNYLIISPFHEVLESGNEEAEADFFNQILIQDDGRLDDLKEGAIIELQRYIAPQSEQIYHSICAVISIENGRLVNETGSFTTFDTFLVNRTIPYKSSSFIGTFEHFSPSDFWGTRVSDAGRRYVANPYENERRFGRNISINSPTNYSYFGDLVKKFEAPGQGDIIAMNITDGKIISAICENDNFLAQASDDLVRVGSDGIIRALPPDQIISDAQEKISGEYGCQYDDIGSVLFGDGYYLWYDGLKYSYVQHDFSLAKSISIGKMDGYFRIKGQFKDNHNSLQTNKPYDKYRWATGLNYATGEVYLTLKTLRLDSVNNELNPYIKTNTTTIYHPGMGEFLGFASFTPEFYSKTELSDASGCSFVTYSKGVPFIHPTITDKFNEFYGITVDEVVGIVINEAPQKQKQGQAMEVQSEMLWFAAEIKTDKITFVSEIPAIRWKKKNGVWNAGFLFNKNSRSGLYGNGSGRLAEDTRGKFISVTLVRDNTDALKYGTIDKAKRVKYNELNLIFTKCSVIEQSGFTENL